VYSYLFAEHNLRQQREELAPGAEQLGRRWPRRPLASRKRHTEPSAPRSWDAMALGPVVMPPDADSASVSGLVPGSASHSPCPPLVQTRPTHAANRNGSRAFADV
jgi:hypothetical protein